MSDESDKPRPSLKDIAKRVSVPPTAVPSQPPPSGPGKAASTPLPVASRPVEASDSDSGMVNLQAVREQSKSLPDTGTQPGTSDLFDEDKDKPKAAAAAVAAPKPAPKKGSAAPLLVGSFVALAAIAAVAVVSLRSKGDAAPESAPVAMASATAPAPADQPAPAATASGEAPAAAASAAPGDTTAAGGAIARKDDKATDTSREPATKSASADKEKPATTAAGPAPTGLEGAMATAVGANTAAPGAGEATPSGPAKHSADVPEIPSQGAIQGAMGAVMGSARACVAGMEDPSRAQVTFVSSGAVSAVSVSGAASGKPAAGCIVSALKRAKVGPFQRSSYSVGVTIRP